MACACRSCLQHSRTLGIAQPPKSKSAIHKAYRAAAKLWHPDRFENNQKKRLEAEERFKRIHAAYDALCEHFDNPIRRAREVEFVTPIRTDPTPTLSFGDAPDCYAAPHFPARIREAIEATRVEPSDPPVGFIDFSVRSLRSSHFILLTKHRMYIRDASGILSVVWYSDLGEIELIDLQAEKKPGSWQRIAETIAGKSQRYSLRINRLNGTEFRVLTDRPDDRVKKVVYNFLRQMKSNSQS
jgi:hypothetical protein